MTKSGTLVILLALVGCGMHREMPSLIGAARDGNVELIRTLIQQGADPNERAGVNGWTPLMHAIHKDQKAAVAALIESGADVNARGDGGSNPLLMAAGYGYADIVGILLDHGADPHVQTKNGENALNMAILGVSDIDRFTIGDCQNDALRVLVQRAPDLKLHDSPVTAAKLKGCAGMSRLLGVRYP